VYPDDMYESGCPLRNQHGAVSLIDFDAILERLPPEQRAAFEAERAERQAELTRHLATHAYAT
jgi:phage terminase Nu1 subunit (DNA packaging protein)